MHSQQVVGRPTSLAGSEADMHRGREGGREDLGNAVEDDVDRGHEHLVRWTLEAQGPRLKAQGLRRKGGVSLS